MRNDPRAFFYPPADVNTSKSTSAATLLPRRIEGVPTPKLADWKSVKRCECEADAIAGSIALSGLTNREIAARMGISPCLITAMVQGTRNLTHKRTAAFCNATGTLLICQYRELERALRESAGRITKADRIASIIQPTQAAGSVAA